MLFKNIIFHILYIYILYICIFILYFVSHTIFSPSIKLFRSEGAQWRKFSYMFQTSTSSNLIWYSTHQYWKEWPYHTGGHRSQEYKDFLLQRQYFYCLRKGKDGRCVIWVQLPFCGVQQSAYQPREALEWNMGLGRATAGQSKKLKQKLESRWEI